MSKPARPLYFFSISVLLGLQILTYAGGQTVDATINVRENASVSVAGSYTQSDPRTNPKQFSLERSAMSTVDLGKRVSKLELFDTAGRRLTYRTLIAGEYMADDNVSAWKYEIDLTPLKDWRATAHASWLIEQRGILMTADLLPIDAVAGNLRINSPAGKVLYDLSSLKTDPRNAVVPIGNGWTPLVLTEIHLNVFIGGEWKFTPAEAETMIREIYTSHRGIFNNDVGESQVLISNFPAPTPTGNWEAETRGSTVTIMSSDMPFRTQSLQRLHEQLRHELFHLWIPNGVNLTGNYDWFYEGFALYRSLKLALSVNRISFADFLDTLSRAHTIDRAASHRQSLIQASANRSTENNTQVYARGMLVAFLVDLAMLDSSKGKRSVEDVLRTLYSKYRKPAPGADGNTAVIELLKVNPAGDLIVKKYVSGTENMEWNQELAAAGIEDADQGLTTTLRVNEKLSGRQKTLLDKLGYNNWRTAPIRPK